MNIGVFDSGVGGLSVARVIQEALPEHKIFLMQDVEHLPYGTKSSEQLLTLVEPILQELVEQDCQVIVVACNTVSTTLIEQLRSRIAVPLIGMEPMIKPAAELTKSKIIAVCATPTTLASARYAWLKHTYASSIKVLEPDCSDWASMIEANRIERHKIQQRIEAACSAGADVVVLGCTHYHWIENVIKEVVKGRADVLQPELPVIAQLKSVLVRLG